MNARQLGVAGAWARDSAGQIRCAPSTSLRQNMTSLTENGAWMLGPEHDPKMHARISEGGFMLKVKKPAPSGWERRTSNAARGREYYYNPATGESHWQATEDIADAMRSEFRESEKEISKLDKMARTQGSKGGITGPFESGGIHYDPQTLAPQDKATQLQERAAVRGKLVSFARRLSDGAPGLRGSDSLRDPEVINALRTIQRRVSSGAAQGHDVDLLMREAKRASIGASKSATDLGLPDSARSLMSDASCATVRLQKVNGAMVNVLSTARIEKKIARNRRATEKFESAQEELRQREQKISCKSVDLGLIHGFCGSETPYLYTDEGNTYRKIDALGGAYSRNREEETRVAQAMSGAENERAKRVRMGFARSLGQPSHRFTPPPNTKPLVAPITQQLGAQQVPQYHRQASGLDLTLARQPLQHRARSRLGM